MLGVEKTVSSVSTATTTKHSLPLFDDPPANDHQTNNLTSRGCDNMIKESNQRRTSNTPYSNNNDNKVIPARQRRRFIQQIRRELCTTTEVDKSKSLESESSDQKQNTNEEARDHENKERGNWSGRFDFRLCCIGCAVGLGNVWRFPYLCFVNGGGAFLIPYTIFLFLCGIPVFLLDLSLGQFTSEGPATCWEFAPIFGGVGYAMTYISTVIAIYYNSIIAYAIYYLFASMTNVLPWGHCKNRWNTNLCRERLPTISCSEENQQPNGTCYNGTVLLGIYDEFRFNKVEQVKRILPSEEYFYREVLKQSGSFSQMGMPDWKLVLCLLGSWALVFVCLIKGIKSFGKVAYVTALFPYVLLLVLFFRGVTLSNAGEGIKYYIVPEFSRLFDAGVWMDAAGQIFFSLSCSCGALLSLSSYNRFHNNVVRDTFIVTIVNCSTSVFAGFVIFSFIGHLAGNMKVPINDITNSGIGLVFIIYPEAMSILPGSTLWAILFFLMIITLGIDSQFAIFETLITSLCDSIHSLRRHKPAVVGFVSMGMFLLGLPLTCPGGNYLLIILDKYCGGWVLLMLGLLECVTIGWVYGRPGFGNFHRFSEDIGLMVRAPIWRGWRYMWQYVSPLLIFAVMLTNWVKYTRTEYQKGSGKYYPIGADVLGWLISLTSVLIILVTALVKLVKEPGDMPWRLRLFNLSIPSYKWGPALPKHRNLMAPYMHQLGALKDFFLYPSMYIKYRDVYPLYDGRRGSSPAAKHNKGSSIRLNLNLFAVGAIDGTEDEPIIVCSDKTAQKVITETSA